MHRAFELSAQKKIKLPYEFICWLPLISDIEPLNITPEEYVNTSCKQQLITKDEVISILTKDYTLRWFITPGENGEIKKIVEKIYSEENPDIKEINTTIKASVENVFDKETESMWENRLFNLIYLLRNNNELKQADIFYTILQNKDYMTLFKQILLQRSIFNYFAGKREIIKDDKFTTNIFRKRNSSETKLDSKKLDRIIDILKKNWINE